MTKAARLVEAIGEHQASRYGSGPILRRPDPWDEKLYAALDAAEKEPEQDADKLVAWMREAADELEKAHRYLDEVAQVPRENPDTGNPFTLTARIAYRDGYR